MLCITQVVGTKHGLDRCALQLFVGLRVIMGCLKSKNGGNSETSKKNTEVETRDMLPLGPPPQNDSTYNVKVVKANGESEPYVPRPKAEPRQYDKSAHITLTVEDLKLAAVTIQTNPGLRVQKLYDQVKTQMNGVTDFLLFWSGKELPLEGEEKTIGDYGILADATIDLVRTSK